jgi:5-methylcytosine-specific restriction endonuclease McrA
VLHPTSTPYRGSSNAHGYGAGWHKISDRVLAEELVCPGYERPCGARTSVVDHIRARQRGGTDPRSDLRAYCRSCNSRKTIAQDRGEQHNR